MQAPGPDPLLGVTIAGRYAIERCVAVGRTARIYQATHLTGSRVAVKVQEAHQASDPAGRARFLNEARQLSRVRHDGIVHIVDFTIVDAPILTHAIVTEWIDGRTLEELLRDGPLPADRAAAVAAEIALCLDAAHLVGIVHRGLRASEVMIVERGREQGRVKVLDWGDAEEILDAADLAAGRAADQRALGLLLHRLVAGGPAGDPAASPPPASVPDWLKSVIARATAQPPESQFPSLLAMAQALRDEPTPLDSGAEPMLRFCPRCGGQSIDSQGYGSPWTGVCNRCGTTFTILMIPVRR